MKIEKNRMLCQSILPVTSRAADTFFSTYLFSQSVISLFILKSDRQFFILVYIL